MTYKERVEKAIEIIHEAGIKNDQINVNDVYEIMKELRFVDIAEEIVELFSLICELRNVLESEDKE